MIESRDGLPTADVWASIFGIDHPWLATDIDSALVSPARELASRSSKSLRAALVEIGYEIGTSETPVDRSIEDHQRIFMASQAIELMHAGSLIVDDIQDASLSRRGRPTIHRVFGTPQALNTGNWLYFWPLRLIDRMDLDAEGRTLARDEYIATLESAHIGQALDLTAKVSALAPEKIVAIVQETIRFKTARVTSLASVLGAIVAKANAEIRQNAARFGLQFGMLLQKYDDLGNLIPRSAGDKVFEDLIADKPTWVWAEAWQQGVYFDLLALSRDARLTGEFAEINEWLERTSLITQAKSRLLHDGEVLLTEATEFASTTAVSHIKEMLGVLHAAYV